MTTPSDAAVTSAISAMLPQEGGYSNNPDDAGGETNLGITKAVAIENGYTGPMAEMTEVIARGIYRQHYWIAPQFDHIDTIDDRLARHMFNVGVNTGVGTAGKFLQRSLNVLNNRAALWPDVKVDGQCGALTQAALTAFVRLRGDLGRRTLLQMIEALDSVRYIELAETRTTDEEFEYGWQSVRAFTD